MSEKRILLTGGSGFLGRELAVEAAKAGYRVWVTFRTNTPPDSKDITPVRLELPAGDEVAALVKDLQPSVVVHMAYSLSDEAVNVHSTRELAEACAGLGQPPHFVFTSTDLVFDGKKGDYSEEDIPEPVMEYGRQKLATEKVVQEVLPPAAIVRPSLIYDLSRLPQHLGFAVNAISRGERFTFFADEFRSPVLADELARLILELCEHRLGGIWHAGGQDKVDRWWFGTRLLSVLGYDLSLADKGSVKGLTSQRPADCSLNTAKIHSALNTKLSGARRVLGHTDIGG